MYAERQTASDGDVAAWLERVTARVRELERENAALKQQLADLRRGVGLAVVIDGQLVPVAPQPPQQPAQQRPSATNRPLETAARPLDTAPHPSVAPAPQTPATGPRHTFGPLASTPDELPAVRGLLPAPRRPADQWLGSGDAWPDAPAPRRQRGIARTLGHMPTAAPAAPISSPAPRVSSPPARQSQPSDPSWRERGPAQDERNPFADSFML